MGKGPNKTVLAKQTFEGVKLKGISWVIKRGAQASPFHDQETSGDSYLDLKVLPWAPCSSVFVAHNVSCLIGDYFFFFLWNPPEKVNHLFVLSF